MYMYEIFNINIDVNILCSLSTIRMIVVEKKNLKHWFSFLNVLHKLFISFENWLSI